jgi:hypothetical protein
VAVTDISAAAAVLQLASNRSTPTHHTFAWVNTALFATALSLLYVGRRSYTRRSMSCITHAYQQHDVSAEW